jgi:hypothetical protein
VAAVKVATWLLVVVVPSMGSRYLDPRGASRLLDDRWSGRARRHTADSSTPEDHGQLLLLDGRRTEGHEGCGT